MNIRNWIYPPALADTFDVTSLLRDRHDVTSESLKLYISWHITKLLREQLTRKFRIYEIQKVVDDLGAPQYRKEGNAL